MDSFQWWYVPILILVWVVGAYVTDYIRRNMYK